jgi:hypothetical protein
MRRLVNCAGSSVEGGVDGVEMKNAHQILVGKPERKRPLERHRRKWCAKILK